MVVGSGLNMTNKRKTLSVSEKTHARLAERMRGMMSMDDLINEVLDRLENVEDYLYGDPEYRDWEKIGRAHV